MEPYFEKMPAGPDEIIYPFECFFTGGYAENEHVSAHYHLFIELIYVIQGSVSIYFSDRTVIITDGDFCVIDSYEVHATSIKMHSDTKAIVMKFDPQLMMWDLNGAKYLLPFLNSSIAHKKVFRKAETADSTLPLLFQGVETEIERQSFGFDFAMKTAICNLFLWIFRNGYSEEVKEQISRASNTIDLYIIKAVDYLKENYKEEISVFALAEKYNVSYSYFSRRFKNYTGQTIKEYINAMRINEAEKLLVTTDKNITEIAMECGFSNSSYFIKQFKIYKSTSPKQYRKKWEKAVL